MRPKNFKWSEAFLKASSNVFHGISFVCAADSGLFAIFASFGVHFLTTTCLLTSRNFFIELLFQQRINCYCDVINLVQINGK